MKQLAVILVFVWAGCSARQPAETANFLHKDYLNDWLIKNEDSMYSAFVRSFNVDSINKSVPKGESKTIEIANGDSASYLGQFTLLAKKYCEGIQVTYIFESEQSKFKILLSTGYRKKYAGALDSIFKSPRNLNHFIIAKYEPPELNPATLVFENGEINTSELSGKFENAKAPYVITILVDSKNRNQRLLSELNSSLSKSLFGEELWVKKIEQVTFKFKDAADLNLLSLYQIRDKLLK